MKIGKQERIDGTDGKICVEHIMCIWTIFCLVGNEWNVTFLHSAVQFVGLIIRWYRCVFISERSRCFRMTNGNKMCFHEYHLVKHHYFLAAGNIFHPLEGSEPTEGVYYYQWSGIIITLLWQTWDDQLVPNSSGNWNEHRFVVSVVVLPKSIDYAEDCRIMNYYFEKHFN